MEATKMLAVAVVVCGMIVIGDGRIAPEEEEAFPGPICSRVAVPRCPIRSVLKCSLDRRGCENDCYCYNPCPKLDCLNDAAEKCKAGNGVQLDSRGCLTCKCRVPECPCCTLDKDKCMMGIRYFFNAKGCRVCACID